ncbi:probable tyrosine-protein kinase SYK at C-terminar half [Coccomyxa sp. Obi]|nr:probable tyrosine-protein kinase SYK at C-terminar half [Coccomyxa sp. Obi]
MALNATPKVADSLVDTGIPYREAIQPSGLLQSAAPLQALLLEQAAVLEAWDAQQCEQRNDLTLLLSELLRKGPAHVKLTHTESPSCRRATSFSDDGGNCGSSGSEVSVVLDSPLLVSMCGQHASAEPAQLRDRSSSVPMDMLTGMPARLPGLRLGRLVGRGSFGRVYRGSWEGRSVAVKVMRHEGSAANRLNALHEALVAQQVKHENVVATYRVHTVERPAGEEEWCLSRPESSQKLHGAAAAARSGNATSLAAAFPAAADGALTSERTGDAAVTSPFHVTFDRAASGCLEAAMQPLSRIARHMSLEPAGCSRDCVKTWWRSLSFGDPVPRMVDIVGSQAADEEQLQAYSMPTCLETPVDSEEAEVVVETLLLMELADLGSLDKYMLHARLKHNRVALIECLLDIAAGMAYLHSGNLLHGDLKTANVLLKSCAASPGNSRGFTSKIADFGLSRVVCDGATHVSTNSHGTVAYVAPEVLQRGVMAMPADVYSYSMLMLELWSGELVYKGVNIHQVMFQVFGGQKPDAPADMPADYRALMEDCWATDPAARPVFRDIHLRLRQMLADTCAATGEATPSK